MKLNIELRVWRLRAAVIAVDSLKAKVACASLAYWAISLSLVPLTIWVSWATAFVLVRNYEAKVAAGRPLAVGEVRRFQPSKQGGGGGPCSI